MTRTKGWPLLQVQHDEPGPLNLQEWGDSPAEGLDEPIDTPTLRETLHSRGLLTSASTVGALLKAGMQHVDDHGYTDGYAEWLTPLVEAAAHSRTG